MKMRKIVLYVALLAIIIGGAPYFTGYLVETKFQDVVKTLSDIDSASIVVVKYDRGWRKSFAQTQVTFSGQYPRALIDAMQGLDPQQKDLLKGTGLTVMLNYDIRHGPFVQMKEGNWKEWRFALATFHSEVLLSEQAKELLEKIVGQSKLVDINGEMSIEGVVQVNFEGIPLKLNAGNVESFVWKGMHGNWKLSRDMKRFQAELVFPGIAIQSRDTSVSARDIIGRYDLHQSPEGLWLGKITGNIQNVAITDPQNPTTNTSFSSMTIGGLSDSESGLLDGSCSITVEQIKMLNKDIGPFNLVASLKNVDANFWKAMIESSQKIRNANSQSQTAFFVQELMAKLPELLKNRPIFSVENISLKTSEGEVKAFLNITVGGADSANINDIAHIIQSIVAKASGIFPKTILVEILTQQYIQSMESTNAVAQQANQPLMTADEIKQKASDKVQETIAEAIKDGYLVEKDDYYSIEWEFSQGQLKVNGKIKSLPQGFSVLPPAGSVNAPGASRTNSFIQ